MRRPHTISLASDERGRIPFALIGVLLLVSSITLVGALEARPTPQPDVDPSIAMDRTNAAIQTALRDATRRATDDAARNPVYKPANNSYGALLNASTHDQQFENYLRLLIYLEVQDALENAGQDIRGTQTVVSVPQATNASTLENGMNQTTLVRPSSGLLEVTIENVTTTVYRDESEIASQTNAYSVTIPTPIFELQSRTDEYEAALNTNVLDGSGFGRQFSGRLYPIAWVRGYAQYGGMPVSEVISNRHVEVTANSAAFATQEAVFGSKDPDGSDAMRQAWLCLAATDADELYGGYNDGDSPRIDSDDVCDNLQYVYGDQVGGDPPDAPSLQDIAGHAPGMDEDLTVAVSESAYVPMRHLFDDQHTHGLPNAFDRVYTVDVASSVDVTEATTRNRPTPPDEGDYWERYWISEPEYLETTVEYANVTAHGEESAYYTYDATVVNEFERKASWNDTRTDSRERIVTNASTWHEFDVHIRLYEDSHSPHSLVRNTEQYGIKTKYNSTDIGVYSSDFSDVPDKAAAEFVGGRTTQYFGDMLGETAWGITSAAEFEAALDIPDTERIDADYEYGKLEADVVEDLVDLQPELAAIEVTFERHEMIKGPDESGPVEELLGIVEAERDAMLERSSPYEDPAEKAHYEARLGYYELLIEDLERVADAHNEVMTGLDDELTDVNSALSDATQYMQEAMSASDPEPGQIDDVPLLDDLEYEISGSPSYLVTENVSATDVPAVDGNETFVPMSTKNSNFFSIPYDTVMTGILSRIPKLNMGDEEERIPMQTAGETLRAAMLAEELGADVGDDVADLEGEVADSIDMIGFYVWSNVYNELDIGNDPGIFEPHYMKEALEEWPTIDQQAVAIGKGEATDAIVEEIIETYKDEYPDEYKNRNEVWEAKIESVARPIVIETIGEQTVDIESTIEDLDANIRDEVSEITDNVIEERLRQAEIVGEDGEIEISDEAEWLTGDAPKRVPAGIPLLPLPGYWIATGNVWDVNVLAAYTRFEVSTNSGSPTTFTETTYVREQTNITKQINGDEIELGHNTKIGFETRTVVVIIVPPGGQGVGDRTGTRDQCTLSWPEIGYVAKIDVNGC
ncbi:hypothetical protein OB919_09800 [Halobacteria archaeon AArc-curdl1]|uniref:Uncharacterized protein n=1 Tax=Natronosalvus hydrolyticus TaxID=2979988 RepID=A0AAP3E6A7_9EURY|nr:hypothetical protein [Halobacteria archaeon AArc-curdl1]